MIVGNQRIAYKNVVFATYLVKHEEVTDAAQRFIQELQHFKVTNADEMFFTIISDSEENPIIIRFFQPINEGFIKIPDKSELSFQSYFFIENTLKTRFLVEGDSVKDITSILNESTQEKYLELLEYIDQNQLEPSTQFFNFQRFVDNKMYGEIQIGIG